MLGTQRCPVAGVSLLQSRRHPVCAPRPSPARSPRRSARPPVQSKPFRTSLVCQAIHHGKTDFDALLIADLELARTLDLEERSSQSAPKPQRAGASQPAVQTQWPTLAPLAAPGITKLEADSRRQCRPCDVHSIRSSIAYVGAQSKPRSFLPEVAPRPQPQTTTSQPQTTTSQPLERALTAVLAEMPSVEAALASDVLEQAIPSHAVRMDPLGSRPCQLLRTVRTAQ